MSFSEEELGSSEESGKDWSDLEREAAEEDKERGEDRYRDDYSSSKKKKANRRQSLSPSKDRYCIHRYSGYILMFLLNINFRYSLFHIRHKHKSSTNSKSKSSPNKDKRSSDKHR